MNNFQEMHTIATQLFHDRIKKFSMPLVDYFGVSHFYFYRITNEGLYSGLGLNPAFGDYFFSENLPLKTPIYRHPDNFESGVIFHKTINDKNWDKILQTASGKFKINFCLQLINKNKKWMDVFDFGLNSIDPFQHMKFIHELPLVKIFIERFMKEFRPFSVLDNHQIDMAHVLGDSFQKIDPLLLQKNNPLEKFLEKMDIQVPKKLTNTEILIIEYLIRGCSATQIAKAVLLSKRTVENYLARIKDKFSCSSKSELIEKAIELKSIHRLIR